MERREISCPTLLVDVGHYCGIFHHITRWIAQKLLSALDNCRAGCLFGTRFQISVSPPNGHPNPGWRRMYYSRGSDFPLQIFADSALEKAKFHFFQLGIIIPFFCCKNPFPLQIFADSTLKSQIPFFFSDKCSQVPVKYLLEILA